MSFRVIAGLDPALAFERPVTVLRAATPAEAEAALHRAESALAQGRWIAGYVSYELGAAFLRLPVRETSLPLLALGVFDAPVRAALPNAERPRASALLPTVDRATYDAALAAIARAIADGDVYQVNYAIPLEFALSGDALALYAAIARSAQPPYAAFVEDGERAILSWSPELFLRFDGERVATKPMKGTAAPNAAAELQSAKNRAEHLMIVDVLRNDLHRICDDVAVDDLFTVERYATFHTMTSTISGRLRADMTLPQIFAATFPCASVTGAPKRSAAARIALLEPFARGVYCGSIGFLSPQRRGWWNVAIRTAQIERASGYGRFYAGGGIVADSQPDAEWEELLLKTRFLRKAQREFALLETFACDAGDAVIAAHLARLAASASAFGIPYDAAALQAVLASHRDAEPVRLIRVHLDLDGVATVEESAREPQSQPVRVRLGDARVHSGDLFLRHKTTWRPIHDAALGEARAHGCFDALLRNERGEPTEGARTNLFVEHEGVLLTPPLSAGVLPGILRARLLAEGRAREHPLTLDNLLRAAAVYVGNSARGLLRAVIEEARR